jgi:hypothetical protein
MADDVLAITASSAEPPVTLFGYHWESSVATYDAGTLFTRGSGLSCPGSLWCRTQRDQGFRTYVPEPDLRLSAPGVLALAWLLAGRRAKFAAARDCPGQSPSDASSVS